jgi:hypothetical protein
MRIWVSDAAPVSRENLIPIVKSEDARLGIAGDVPTFTTCTPPDGAL